jgi:hypothetical protein
MSYYQGDYYRGGFFSFLGGIAKKAIGFIPGVGPIASTVAGLIPSGARKVAAGALARAGTVGAVAGRAIARHPVLSAAAAAGAVAGGASMVGHGRGVAMHPALHGARGMGGLRRRKRMNVCNPRALRRSIRRTHGFAKLAMKTIHLIHPKKKVRFGGFRKHKKK